MSLRLDYTGPIGHLLMDRPEKRNAFTQSMWEALPRLLAEAAANPSVRVLILQSATPGLFCAGADIGELLAHQQDADWLAANQAAINRAQYELARFPKPVIAFIDGDSIGGGCGLALACDIRVASTRARLGITPAKLGLVYPLHDTKLLVDLVGPGQAKRLLFSAQLLDAEAALAIGLIEECADSPMPLAQMIAEKSLHSTTHTKRFIRQILEGQSADDAETLQLFAEAFLKPDFQEGSAAFLQKRPAKFR